MCWWNCDETSSAQAVSTPVEIAGNGNNVMLGDHLENHAILLHVTIGMLGFILLLLFLVGFYFLCGRISRSRLAARQRREEELHELALKRARSIIRRGTEEHTW